MLRFRQVGPAARVHLEDRYLTLFDKDAPSYDRLGASSPPAGARKGDADDADDDDGVGAPTVITTTVLQTSATALLFLPTPTTIIVTNTLVETLTIPQIAGTPRASSLLQPTSSPSAVSSTSPATSSPASTSSSAASSSVSVTSNASQASVASTTSSSVSSTSLHMHTTTAPSPSPTAQSTKGALVADSAIGGAKSGSGVPGGAIAAIVIVLLLCAGGLAFFLYRRRQARNRQMRRATWKIGIPGSQDEFSSMEKGTAASSLVSPYMLGAPGSDLTSGETSSQSSMLSAIHVTRKPPESLAPPPTSYNNPPSPHNSLAVLPPLSPLRTTPVSPRSPLPTTTGTPTFVRVTFIPSLPDELAITPGETLRIASAFDDGWALCVNSRGKQGMVPLECLEGGGGQFVPAMVPGDGLKSKRESSLTVGTRASMRSTRS